MASGPVEMQASSLPFLDEIVLNRRELHSKFNFHLSFNAEMALKRGISWLISWMFRDRQGFLLLHRLSSDNLLHNCPSKGDQATGLQMSPKGALV